MEGSLDSHGIEQCLMGRVAPKLPGKIGDPGRSADDNRRLWWWRDRPSSRVLSSIRLLSDWDLAALRRRRDG